MKARKNYEYGVVKPKIKCDPTKKAQQHFKNEVNAGKIVARYKKGLEPKFGQIRKAELKEYGIQINQEDLMKAKNKMLKGEKSEFEKAVEKHKAEQNVAKANTDGINKVLNTNNTEKVEQKEQPKG